MALSFLKEQKNEKESQKHKFEGKQNLMEMPRPKFKESIYSIVAKMIFFLKVISLEN